MSVLRSWMFVPGHSERMVGKSLALDVDVVMLDLEDGVVPALKNESRTFVAAGLRAPGGPATPQRYVRVNGADTPWLDGDLEAIVMLGLAGIVLPKVESVDSVCSVARRIDALEESRGLLPGSVRMMLAIETARAIIVAPDLATASPRVSGLMFGAEDFSRDIGLPTVRCARAREFIHARSAIVMACHAARVLPIDNVWPDLSDQAGLEQDAQLGRDLGFTGKSLIHPSQIASINSVYSPTKEDVTFARNLVREFDAAYGEGRGSISFSGQLVDRPIYERAKAVLDLDLRIRAERSSHGDVR